MTTAAHNAEWLRSNLKAGETYVGAIVKADGYGHGAVRAAGARRRPGRGGQDRRMHLEAEHRGGCSDGGEQVQSAAARQADVEQQATGLPGLDVRDVGIGVRPAADAMAGDFEQQRHGVGDAGIVVDDADERQIGLPCEAGGRVHRPGPERSQPQGAGGGSARRRAQWPSGDRRPGNSGVFVDTGIFFRPFRGLTSLPGPFVWMVAMS